MTQEVLRSQLEISEFVVRKIVEAGFEETRRVRRVFTVEQAALPGGRSQSDSCGRPRHRTCRSSADELDARRPAELKHEQFGFAPATTVSALNDGVV